MTNSQNKGNGLLALCAGWNIRDPVYIEIAGVCLCRALMEFMQLLYSTYDWHQNLFKARLFVHHLPCCPVPVGYLERNKFQSMRAQAKAQMLWSPNTELSIARPPRLSRNQWSKDLSQKNSESSWLWWLQYPVYMIIVLISCHYYCVD